MSESVITEHRGSVANIVLSRPKYLNAMDPDAMRLLRSRLQELATDVRVTAVTITGQGRAFCAGGDIGSMEENLQKGRLPELFHELAGEQELVVREVVTMPKPVIASLPGVAAGGGLSLALAADWRIASPNATLVPAFPALGAVPDGGLSYFLPHFLGIGLAQELLFTNAHLSADRARELGLLHEIVSEGELSSRTQARADELAAGPTLAYGWLKRLLISAYSNSFEAQLALERRGVLEAARGRELPEGIRAFREKRRAQFDRSTPGQGSP